MTAEEIIKELRRRAAEQFREAERADSPHKQYYAGSAWAYADAEALLSEHLCAKEQPNTPAVTLCHRCKKNHAVEPHTCPYSVDVHEDSKTLCICCAECKYQCADDI